MLSGEHEPGDYLDALGIVGLLTLGERQRVPSRWHRGPSKDSITHSNQYKYEQNEENSVTLPIVGFVFCRQFEFQFASIKLPRATPARLRNRRSTDAGTQDT